MKQTELYCEKNNDKYNHFFPSILQVKSCGAKKENIIKVLVMEIKENETPTHYGW